MNNPDDYGTLLATHQPQHVNDQSEEDRLYCIVSDMQKHELSAAEEQFVATVCDLLAIYRWRRDFDWRETQSSNSNDETAT